MFSNVTLLDGYDGLSNQDHQLFLLKVVKFYPPSFAGETSKHSGNRHGLYVAIISFDTTTGGSLSQ